MTAVHPNREAFALEAEMAASVARQRLESAPSDYYRAAFGVIIGLFESRAKALRGPEPVVVEGVDGDLMTYADGRIEAL